jgi:iron complex outermembrane receptor protein
VIAFGGLAIAPWVVMAQDANPESAQLQRVEITGSSIKRVAAEAALPVQTFTQADIRRSGVTSVTDFVQQLPVMQGFTAVSDSVGGGGGGITTASIHDIGEQYTLVLVNGRRIAPATSGNTIDINAIPLSAIDRIEVLTDGASALYGSDAIAGVLNFILKKGASPFTIEAKVTKAQHPGAGGESVNISKGFGDIDADGYSLFVSASHQKDKRLTASQRSFASTGMINFADPLTGQNLFFFNGSSRSIPPNVAVVYHTPTLANPNHTSTVNVNPYLQLNGTCPPAHINAGDGNCYFDYTSTVEIQPEVSRDNFYVAGSAKLGQSGFTGFANLSYNNSHVYSTIAPYPAEFSLATTSPLFATYVSPYLTATQLANIKSVTVKYRLLDLGGRAYDYDSVATNLVAGVEGNVAGWDINSALTLSQNDSPQNYVGGFPLADKFTTAMNAGTIDPFPYATGQMPAAMIDALKATQFVGNYNTTNIKMNSVDAHGSREVFKLGGGMAQLGIGGDLRQSKYKQTANQAVAHSEILFDSDQPEFDLSRPSKGAFAELLMPISKQLEVTGAVRYDSVGKVTDGLSNQTFGTDQSAGTYKLSARFQPASNLMFRAAYGTGFKVASMQQIAQPLSDFGVTANTYNCPLPPSNPLSAYCSGSKGQLEEFQGGNPDLKPERSTQKSVGLVFDPTNNFSMKLDLWYVSIKDAVTSPSEELITADPVKYASLYTTKFKASTGTSTLAIILQPMNIGLAENAGLDYDFIQKMKLGEGKLTNRFSGTYLFRDRYTTPGTDNSWESSLDNYGSNNAVSFRHVIKLSSTYEGGPWTHGLTMNYRSGYKDVLQTASNCAVSVGDVTGDCIDVQLDVPAYYTFDWQTKYVVMKGFELTGGVINMADKAPPLTLRTAGSHQLGYDPRYASATGRTFYVIGSYKF